MVNPTIWWPSVKFALGFAAGVTSLVWAIAVYKAGIAGTRVAAITNQLALASICQVNNGTVDDVLCGSYLTAFNKNFPAILTAVARADGSTSINLLPSDSQHRPLSITIFLVITFSCTAVGVLSIKQLAGQVQRRVEMRETVKEIDKMNQEPSGENKASGVVDVRPLRA